MAFGEKILEFYSPTLSLILFSIFFSSINSSFFTSTIIYWIFLTTDILINLIIPAMDYIHKIGTMLVVQQQ